MNKYLPCLAVVLLPVQSTLAAEPFTLKEGDRVVMLGNTLIEREQRYGYWELALTARFPGVTFRNLGWSGDTVWGEARAGFGTQADGFKQLVQHVLAEKPTVLIIGYGGNEAFAGPAGLPKFEKGLNDLLDALAPTKARVVLLSPTPHEYLRSLLPDPKPQNKNIALYSSAIHETAKRRACGFRDLFESNRSGFEDSSLDSSLKFTDNGVHLSPQGYWLTQLQVAPVFVEKFVGGWSIRVADDGKVSATGNVKVERVEAKGHRFHAGSAFLISRLPERADDWNASGDPTSLRVAGLPPGKYTLYVDGKPSISASAKEWAEGRSSIADPNYDQAEKLRQLIVEKNRLYFYRWRPQNVTYLFGFRKGEQGQNAIEIPQFDPLIAAKEAEIAKLRVPVPHVYELKRE